MPTKEQIYQIVISAPFSQKAMAAGLLIVLTGLLYWYNIYADLTTKLEDLEKKVEQQNAEIETKRKQVGQLPEFQAQLARLQANLKLATKSLPSEREIPELLTSLARLAEQCGLQLKRFELKGEIAKQFYAEVPIEMEVDGSYHDLVFFYSKIAAQDTVRRIVNVSSISLVNPREQNQKIVLSAKFIATTYRYMGDGK
ncbi:MAG: hypothetical protein GMKNLPBB_01914 [Myxococcota bacterium]|nr:hypothetical protein [Myxococcota bacterium]